MVPLAAFDDDRAVARFVGRWAARLALVALFVIAFVVLAAATAEAQPETPLAAPEGPALTSPLATVDTLAAPSDPAAGGKALDPAPVLAPMVHEAQRVPVEIGVPELPVADAVAILPATLPVAFAVPAELTTPLVPVTASAAPEAGGGTAVVAPSETSSFTSGDAVTSSPIGSPAPRPAGITVSSEAPATPMNTVAATLASISGASSSAGAPGLAALPVAAALMMLAGLHRRASLCLVRPWRADAPPVSPA